MKVKSFCQTFISLLAHSYGLSSVLSLIFISCSPGKSRLASEPSLVCNWYSRLLLDDINDCKIQSVIIHLGLVGMGDNGK